MVAAFLAEIIENNGSILGYFAILRALAVEKSHRILYEALLTGIAELLKKVYSYYTMIFIKKP